MAAACKSFASIILAAAAFLTQAPPVMAQAPGPVIHLPSTLQTTIRAEFNNTRSPVLRIAPGQTVRIDTVSHGGAVPNAQAYFARAGIPADQVLKDVVDIGASARTDGVFPGHVLTGPIYIEAQSRATCWRSASTLWNRAYPTA